MHAFQIAIAPKLQFFQYRVLSKKFTTNIDRNRWDSSIMPWCTFCEDKPETIAHLLVHCKVVQEIWKKLKKWLKYICKVDIKISEYDIIINKSDVKGSNKCIDHIVLITKQYIYSCKCKVEKPKIRDIIGRVNEQYSVEKIIAQQNNKIRSHMNKWRVYIENIL